MKKNKYSKDFPLVFRIDNREMREHVPVIWGFMVPLWIHYAWVLRIITGNSSYFHLRAGYDIKQRKSMDLAFILHYVNVHQGSLIKASLSERLRYKRYWRMYCFEVTWLLDLLTDPYNVPVDIASYMQRYNFGGTPDPFLVEFFHGMDSPRFREYDNMYSDKK